MAETIILPVVGRSGFASYLICRFVILPGYIERDERGVITYIDRSR